MRETEKNVKRRRSHFVILFIISVALACTVCFAIMIRASNIASQEAGVGMSTLYLRVSSQDIGK